MSIQALESTQKEHAICAVQWIEALLFSEQRARSTLLPLQGLVRMAEAGVLTGMAPRATGTATVVVVV